MWFAKADAVCVLEQRGRTVWERTARGRNRGRTRLLVEASTDAEAAVALEERRGALEADGYVLVDVTAGVDALHPAGAAVVIKPSISDFVRDLTRALEALPDHPQLREVLRVFDACMRQPRSFQTRGFAFDTTVRGHARVVARVKSTDDCWREIGFAVALDVPDDRDTSQEFIDEVSGPWKTFHHDFTRDDAWIAIEDLPCSSVELVDDEID